MLFSIKISSFELCVCVFVCFSPQVDYAFVADLCMQEKKFLNNKKAPDLHEGNDLLICLFRGREQVSRLRVLMILYFSLQADCSRLT